MGKVGKFISSPFRAIFGAGDRPTTVQQSTAAMAAPAAADAQNNDTNIDTDATKRKKKAMGKKSLMIGAGSDSVGGGTTGTVLNI